MCLFSRFCRGVRSDDANELVCQVAYQPNCYVYAIGKARVVRWILGAGDNSLVRVTLPMKAFKIGMIMSEHGSLVGDGTSKNYRVVNALARPTRMRLI